MSDFEIPRHLIDMLMEHRVIPFLGAGFSAPLDMPSWDALLSGLVQELDPSLTYDEIKEHCQGDPLQIAEYLYLQSDESIGPLRHAIERRLQTNVSPVVSTAHVELVNLGMPQVYTTNFDDLIERTYRDLGESCAVVALPKHVAASDAKKPQVVKYHGDLRHEKTLVLTESSYYARLDLESPMDLKFRSDLLGRSVLFMGYSFRDINIRVVWFRLMRMMKDIPQGDRPPSYIVRFTQNPVLDRLYEAVGLSTIVLDPHGKAKTPEDLNALAARFVLELAIHSSENPGFTGATRSIYLSVGLLEEIQDELRRIRVSTPNARKRPPSVRYLSLMHQLQFRQVPNQLKDAVNNFLVMLAKQGFERSLAVPLALRMAAQFGPSLGVTLFMTRILWMEAGAREQLLAASGVPWTTIWGVRLPQNEALNLVQRMSREVDWHEHEVPDADLAFLSDIVARLARGQLVDPASEEVRDEATRQLARAGAIYPSIASYQPDPEAPPRVASILEEMRVREAALEDGDEPDEDFGDFDLETEQGGA